MTLDGKSASLPGGQFRSVTQAEDTNIYSFSNVVDEACEKLMEKQIKYSIQRIQKMEEDLCALEKELDDFLGKSDFLLQKNREFA